MGGQGRHGLIHHKEKRGEIKPPPGRGITKHTGLRGGHGGVCLNASTWVAGRPMNRSAAKAGVGECKGSSYWGGARGAERHTDCTTVDGVKSHHTDQLKEENEAMD